MAQILVTTSGLWTGLVLCTLTWGVQGFSREDMDSRGLLPPTDTQDAILLTLLREMYEQQLLKQVMAQQQQQQPSLPSDVDMNTELQKRPHFEPLVLPLPLSSQSGYIDETSKEGDKRASNYMSFCHFKICSMGKKRAGSRLYARFRK